MFLLFAGTLAGLPATQARAGDANWQFSESATYERGTFGTGDETTTVYVPATIKRYLDMGDVSLVVPYLHLDGSGLVTTIDGTPIRGAKRKSAKTPPSVSADGLGDIVLKGSFYLLNEETQFINLSPVGNIKFPTASRSDGLGTGKFDEGFGAEASKTILKGCQLFADTYYTIIGSPVHGQTLDNQFAFDLGAGYQLLPALNLSGFYEYKTAVVSGTSAPSDLAANAEYKFTDSLHLFCGVLAGLSSGSPDFGATLGTSIRF
jgi:outer membrane putative beta-barrel porin/alpha-amylase